VHSWLLAGCRERRQLADVLLPEHRRHPVVAGRSEPLVLERRAPIDQRTRGHRPSRRPCNERIGTIEGSTQKGPKTSEPTSLMGPPRAEATPLDTARRARVQHGSPAHATLVTLARARARARTRRPAASSLPKAGACPPMSRFFVSRRAQAPGVPSRSRGAHGSPVSSWPRSPRGSAPCFVGTLEVRVPRVVVGPALAARGGDEELRAGRPTRRRWPRREHAEGHRQ